MATYFVHHGGNSSAPTSDPGTSGSWPSAYATLATALAAATTAGDIIKVSDEHVETLSGAWGPSHSANSTYANPIRVVCVDHQDTSVLSTGARIEATSTAYAISFTGGRRYYYYGITFDTGTTATGAADISLTSGISFFVFESCTFKLSNNTGTQLAINGGTANSRVDLINCDVHFRNASSIIYVSGFTTILGGNMSAGSTHPTVLFGGNSSSYNPCLFLCEGADLSNVTGTLVAGTGSSLGTGLFTFVGCKLGSGVTPCGTITNAGDVEVLMYDCSSGDEHYHIVHHNFAGKLTASTAIKMNTADAALYDGTNGHSLSIVTNSTCSTWFPYISPPIDVYHSGTSSISPYVEILRNNDSTSAYTDAEVWTLWSAKVTASSTKYSYYSQRVGVLSSAANLADGAGLTAWDGESGSCKSVKSTQTFTPAEIGHLRCRICVGLPSKTIYINPKILGLS